MPKPLAIQTEHLDAEPAAWLSERCELIKCDSSDAKFNELLPRAEALVIRTYTQVNQQLLDRAPKLRVVGRAGVGLDNVDIPACLARNVTVVSTPDANSSAVVEYVMALMFDAVRPRLFLEQALDHKRWKDLREELKAPRELNEMTLGVLGLGRIGSRLARAVSGLGMRVIYHDLLEIPAARRFGATPVSRDELCAQSDILSIHVDPRRSNHGLIGAEYLAKCKGDVILINCARGVIINAPSLADFMLAHPRAMALLDVHDPEPFGPAYPLLSIPNVQLSPHIAAATQQANRNMSWVVRDVWRVLSGEKPEFPANPEPA
jgi:phosphoglycerate dehydrogenase-like enzyme